jgi:hypothetical protein
MADARMARRWAIRTGRGERRGNPDGRCRVKRAAGSTRMAKSRGGQVLSSRRRYPHSPSRCRCSHAG